MGRHDETESFVEVVGRFRAALGALANLQREVRATRAALPRIHEQDSTIGRLLKAVANLRSGPVLAAAGKLARHARNAQALDDAGWLAHHSTPFDRIDECG